VRVRLAPVFAVLFLAGCGLLRDEPKAAPEVTPEDLAVMVVPGEEIGPAVDPLEVDPEDSGPETAAKVAKNTIDPKDKGKTIVRGGWLAGYELNYSDPKRAAAFRSQEGLVAVGSSVDVFETDSAARELLVKEIRDYQRFNGKTVDGAKLERFETFEAPVGDEAWGIELTAAVGDTRVYVTGVYFRHGRLVGGAGYLRADPTVVRAAATRLALALDERIEKRLAGELEDRPVPLPETTNRKPVPSMKNRKLDPKEFTLNATDVPGASVAGAGYRQHGEVRSFLREFKLRGDRLGKSSVLYFRAMTQVLEDPVAADDFLAYSESFQGGRDLTRNLARGALKVAPSGIMTGPVPTRGNDTAAIVSYFGPQGKRLTAVMVLVRYGSLIGSVTAVGRGNELNPRDVTALIPTLRARLRAGV